MTLRFIFLYIAIMQGNVNHHDVARNDDDDDDDDDDNSNNDNVSSVSLQWLSGARRD